MLANDEILWHLIRDFGGTCRSLAGEMLVFFDHGAVAQRFADAARERGYRLNLLGAQVHIHGETRCQRLS